MSFSVHPDAQVEFTAIRQGGGSELLRCLGLMMKRSNRIYDGTEPLQRPQEFIGPGQRLSALFAVEFSYSLATGVEAVYEQLGPDVVVLAVDATRMLLPFGQRVGGDARKRSRQRSR